jgi:hypothetical protein
MMNRFQFSTEDEEGKREEERVEKEEKNLFLLPPKFYRSNFFNVSPAG